MHAIDRLFAFGVFDWNANRIQAIECAKYAIRECVGDSLVPDPMADIRSACHLASIFGNDHPFDLAKPERCAHDRMARTPPKDVVAALLGLQPQQVAQQCGVTIGSAECRGSDRAAQIAASTLAGLWPTAKRRSD